MAWCIPKHLTDKFIQGLKSGDIDPIAMMDMSSEQRRDLLAKYIGEENAPKANAMYESKLLLKDQQRGMITWIKNVGGIKESAKRDMVSRVNRMDKILTPETEDAFYEDLAAQKLGITVNIEEAENIAKLAKEATDKKEVMEKGPRRKGNGQWTEAEREYGFAARAFSNYVRDLKLEANKMTVESIKADPTGSVKKIGLKAAGVSKSMRATFDHSIILRQGWKVMMTHPDIWWNNTLESFSDIAKSAGGEAIVDEVMAYVLSSPEYDNMVKDKLGVDKVEEEFPESDIVEKIPVFGKVHKVANDVFTAFAYRNRAQLYEYYADVLRKSGETEITGKGVGKLANSLGSRGSLGRLESVADVANVLFFSLRNTKANFDVLTAHLFSKDISPVLRKRAAINLVKVIGGTAAVLAMAAAMGADVEKDPRSPDFGKAKVGNTRFDFSGGASSIYVLASRLALMSTKSSTTGKITPLNQGAFTGRTGEDLVYDFFANKYSPAASVVRNLLRGSTFEGEEPTIFNTAEDLFVPIPIETGFELLDDPDSANFLLGMLAETLGIGTQTYSPKQGKKKKAPKSIFIRG